MKTNWAVCILLGLLPCASAQTAPLVAQLRKTVVFDDIALSPDGKSVAWVQGTAGTEESFVHISSTSPGSDSRPARAQTEKDNTDTGPSWSPDSQSLAFISTGKDRSKSLIWTVGANGSRVPKQTSINGFAARPKWSHDGHHIAFLFVEGATGGGPLMAAPTMTGVIDTAFHNQRIGILDVASGTFQPASTPSLHIYDFDWSPDDQSFVVTGAPGPGDNNWWIAQLYLLNRMSGTYGCYPIIFKYRV